jgi:hypothetical protein
VNRAPVHACIAYSMHIPGKIIILLWWPLSRFGIQPLTIPVSTRHFSDQQPRKRFSSVRHFLQTIDGKNRLSNVTARPAREKFLSFFLYHKCPFFKALKFFSRPPGLQEGRRDILLVFLNSHFHWTLKFTIMTFQMHWIVSVSSRWQSPFQRDNAFLTIPVSTRWRFSWKRFPLFLFAIPFSHTEIAASLSVLFYR